MSEKIRTTIAVVALATIALTGCTGGEKSTDAPRGTNSPTATTEPVPEPSEAEAPTSDGTLAFGETFNWENGVSMTITGPEFFKRDEWASGGEEFDDHVAFEILIVNGSDEPLDLALFTATAQSGNIEADPVFDTDNRMEGSPTTKVLPGREISFRYGFGVADPEDIVLEATPGWEYDSALWVSNG